MTGLAVADEGRKVYIIAGRAAIRTNRSNPKSHDVGDDLSAEIFELDLGLAPLGPSTTAHWRQVYHSKPSAISARAV